MSFKARKRIQLSGEVTWVVVTPDEYPVAECASIVWASVIVDSLNNDLARSTLVQRLEQLIAEYKGDTGA